MCLDFTGMRTNSLCLEVGGIRVGLSGLDAGATRAALSRHAIFLSRGDPDLSLECRRLGRPQGQEGP